MLLRFFRINDPYRLLGVLLILALLSIPFFVNPAAITIQELKSVVLGEAVQDGKVMYAQVLDATPPLSSYVFGCMDWMFGRSLSARHLVALLILFFQAAFFAALLINNRAYADNTYLPALIFGVLCFWSYDFLSFSSELLASTILLLALNNLFKEIEFRIQRDEIAHNLGVFLGLSSLFVFSYVVFLFATILILILFSRISLRKTALIIFGFLLPHLLLNCFYYYFGHLTSLWEYFYKPNLVIGGEHLISVRSLFWLGLVPIAYFVFSLFMLQREARFTKYQSQLFQIMFLWLLFAIAHVSIARALSPQSFLIFIPPLSYFISHYLLLIRRKWIAEVMLWLFLVGIIGMNLMARNGRIKSIDYAGMTPAAPRYTVTPGQRVMTLADDFGIYAQNRLAGFFPDWSLAQKILREPDYYENVLFLYDSFKKDPPDVVVDPDNVLNKFMDRIPELQRFYKRDGDYYVRIKAEKVSN